MTDQVGQLASTPLMDPQKNPELIEAVNSMATGMTPQPTKQFSIFFQVFNLFHYLLYLINLTVYYYIQDTYSLF